MQEKTESRELTENEYSFCVEYIKCGKKPSEAYKNSLYSSDNMTKQTIATKSYLLLQKEYIRDMIIHLESEVRSEIKDELKYNLQWTLEKIGILAETGKSESNRLKALEMLMKHNGGYEKDNNQKVEPSKSVNINFSDIEAQNKNEL